MALWMKNLHFLRLIHQEYQGWRDLDVWKRLSHETTSPLAGVAGWNREQLKVKKSPAEVVGDVHGQYYDLLGALMSRSRVIGLILTFNSHETPLMNMIFHISYICFYYSLFLQYSFLWFNGESKWNGVFQRWSPLLRRHLFGSVDRSKFGKLRLRILEYGGSPNDSQLLNDMNEYGTTQEDPQFCSHYFVYHSIWGNYLFLGDYVDRHGWVKIAGSLDAKEVSLMSVRGKNSIECISLLFAYKAPGAWFRGRSFWIGVYLVEGNKTWKRKKGWVQYSWIYLCFFPYHFNQH